MSLLETETVEYSQSSDELMLKELERRDGIYSFIFHELETTKEGGNYMIDKTNGGHKSNGFKQNQFIIYKVNEMETETKWNTPTGIKLEDSAILTTTTQNPVQSVITTTSSNCGADAMKTSFSFTEFWKTCHATSLNTPPSYRFLDQPNLYNYVATGSFRVRLATPRFSHNSVPLVRNRRHALKDTAEYKSFVSRSIGHAPDLRSLFPQDPDVHAPFAEISCASDVNDAGAVHCEYEFK